jgi:peptidoglycan/xylan/chitin deacetylase (PgdA/CDA1 family)
VELPSFRPTSALAVLLLALTLAAPPADGRPTPWPQPTLGPSRSGDPEVLFTFDDGPDEHTTPLVLEALRPYGIKTIFFEVGRRTRGDHAGQLRRRAVQQRLLAEGHILGNHTLTHVHLCMISGQEAVSEMDGEQALLTLAMGGMEPAFFRAPYGDRCPRLEAQLAARGWQNIHWDLDPHEWQSNSSDDAFAYMVQHLRRLQGRAVVLFHDTKEATVHALPRVLAWIQAENLRRVAAGLRPIRLLSYPDIARERIPLPVQALVDSARTTVLSLLPDLTRRLVLPLTGTFPVVVPSPPERVVAPVAHAAPQARAEAWSASGAGRAASAIHASPLR